MNLRKRLFALTAALFIGLCGIPALADGTLSLDDALKLAEQNNLALLSAGEDLKAAKADEFQAYWRFGLTGDYSYSNDSDGTKETKSVGLSYGRLGTITWTNGPERNADGTYSYVDSWRFSLSPLNFSEILQIKQASFKRLSSEVKYRTTLEGLRLEVSSAYYDVLENDALAALAARSLEAATRRYEDGKAKEKAGILARADLIRLEAAVYQQRASMAQSRGGATMARAKLAGLLGIDDAKLGTLAPPAEFIVGDYTEEAVIQSALENRGEIRMADAQIQLARLAHTAAMLQPLQGVSLTVSPSQMGDGTTYKVGASFSLGGSVAGLKSAEASLASAEYAAKSQRSTVEMQAKQAYISFEVARERVEFTRLSMVAAKEVARVTALRYDTGLATVTENLEAIIAAEQAEQQYVQAQYDLLLAEAQIRQATWSSAAGASKEDK